MYTLFNQWQIEIGQRTKKKVEWDGYLFFYSQGFQLTNALIMLQRFFPSMSPLAP